MTSQFGKVWYSKPYIDNMITKGKYNG